MNYLHLKGKKSTFKITALISLLVSSFINIAQASDMEKRIEIAQFNNITLAKGLDVTIICKDTLPYVIANGSRKVLDKLQVDVHQKKLSIMGTAKDYDSWDFADNKATLKIYTNTPIETIRMMLGVKFTADACAISKKELNVDGSMGASFVISGQTEKLNAELSMGTTFNSDIDTFKVDTANVSMTMGAEANLCNAKVINGSVSMGGIVYIGSHTIDNINATMGAIVKTRNCKL
ncbi:GIN domain-containing protein [Photorhabdus sp. SF281]|uniref:GIN domain-containing protein n=1 Tax=Photorhabdus sp. SF281 TaxID=3459527 RepID=UPI004044384A